MPGFDRRVPHAVRCLGNAIADAVTDFIYQSDFKAAGLEEQVFRA